MFLSVKIGFKIRCSAEKYVHLKLLCSFGNSYGDYDYNLDLSELRDNIVTSLELDLDSSWRL